MIAVTSVYQLTSLPIYRFTNLPTIHSTQLDNLPPIRRQLLYTALRHNEPALVTQAVLPSFSQMSTFDSIPGWMIRSLPDPSQRPSTSDDP